MSKLTWREWLLEFRDAEEKYIEAYRAYLPPNIRGKAKEEWQKTSFAWDKIIENGTLFRSAEEAIDKSLALGDVSRFGRVILLRNVTNLVLNKTNGSPAVTHTWRLMELLHSELRKLDHVGKHRSKSLTGLGWCWPETLVNIMSREPDKKNLNYTALCNVRIWAKPWFPGPIPTILKSDMSLDGLYEKEVSF